MAIAEVRWLFLMVFFYSRIHVMVSLTDRGDAMALQSLKSSWRNTPANWNESDDPCGLPWTGVTCANSRVTSLELSASQKEDQPPAVGLEGELISKIGDLTQLITLILSGNKHLIGPLTPRLGNLKNLVSLNLEGCSFSGNIPAEIGNLAHLSFFYLNNNKLTGPIPSKLFSSNMVLESILLSSNQLSGKIPTTLGLVQTLTNLYLDGNAFSGAIPSTISNLVNLNELRLGQNRLSGALPDLSKMASLRHLDLSNNSFDAVEVPAWFSTLRSLSTLFMTHGSFHGPFPTELLSLPMITTIELADNAFNGTLTIGGANISSQLENVNLVNNKISTVTLGSNFTASFKLKGNPVCEKALLDTIYCDPSILPYSTSLQQCGNKTCTSNRELLSPNSCTCVSPLQGILYFPSPSFRDVSRVDYFRSLEMSLSNQLGLSPGSVYLHDPNFNDKDLHDHLSIYVAMFPSNGIYFTKSDVASITIPLTNHSYKPPQVFGANYNYCIVYSFK